LIIARHPQRVSAFERGPEAGQREQ